MKTQFNSGDTTSQGRVMIHPNPAEDVIQVSLPDEKSTVNGQWEIYASSGIKIDEGRYSSNIFQYSTVHLADGVYYIFINTGTKKFQSKFIKL